jgi:hypothetical protein
MEGTDWLDEGSTRAGPIPHGDGDHTPPPQSEILLRGEKHDHVRYTPHPDRNAERSLLDVGCGRNSFEKE